MGTTNGTTPIAKGNSQCRPARAASNLDGGSDPLLDPCKIRLVEGGVSHAAVVVEALLNRRSDGEVHAKLQLQGLSQKMGRRMPERLPDPGQP